ncbi:MAG TPA: glycoside hydrolase family 43 protein [Acidimicrobiales bacterium]|nr:glycoside hydrolase family 43 protein [Acidimicrobiales bacterium]
MRGARRALVVRPLIMAVVLAVAATGVGIAGMRPAAAAGFDGSPLFPGDLPDPFVVRTPSGYFAFGTNGLNGFNVPVVASGDLSSWGTVHDALPELPPWASAGHTWAPSVARLGSSYVLFYAARHATTGRQCIGRAVASSPAGPYHDTSAQPFVCQLDRGGSIDPSVFVDRTGAPWLLYKSEGVAGSEPTRIWSQPLSGDGSAFAGGAVELATTDQAWEGNIVEGPAMVDLGGSYWLLYGGNTWENASYAIGYARCDTPAGPCVKDGRGPLVSSATTGVAAGPGGPEVVQAPDGSMLLTFHAWDPARIGYPNGGRRTLRALPLSVVDARLAVPGTAPAVADGYRLIASDGGIFAFGAAGFYGSTGDMTLNAPIVTAASTPSGHGYWLVGSDGGIFSFGDARFYGSTGGMRLNKSIVGMAPTPTGRGYWLVASDGGIFAFGDATYAGSTGNIRLNRPIIAMASTPTGRGYWLVASDGGMFSFGDARFLGSTGSISLNAPIAAMVATTWGDGYWLVASDGGVFAFGAAPYLGSTGGVRLNAPIVGAAATPAADGYWFVASDGGLFAFGAAPFHGSMGASALNRPIVAFGT